MPLLQSAARSVDSPDQVRMQTDPIKWVLILAISFCGMTLCTDSGGLKPLRTLSSNSNRPLLLYRSTNSQATASGLDPTEKPAQLPL